MNRQTREEFYEFLDLSGVDDSEKDELKSTLYDNNGNSGIGSKSNRGVGVNSGTNNRGRGGNFQANRTYTRPLTQQQQQPLPTGANTYNKSRPKPTTWVTNRKFQGGTSATNQTAVVATKRYAYQQTQQLNHKSNISNNNSSAGDITTEYNQGSSIKNRSATTTSKRNYDVNCEIQAKTAAAGNQHHHHQHHPHRRTNSANSTDSVDYSCDDTSYGKPVLEKYLCFFLKKIQFFHKNSVKYTFFRHH